MKAGIGQADKGTFSWKGGTEQACCLLWKIRGMMRFRASVMKGKETPDDEEHIEKRRGRRRGSAKSFSMGLFYRIYYSDVDCC